MPDTKSVRQIPPISCVDAVRSLSEDERDKILRRGLDKKVVATLAGAVAQLSGRGDMAGQYGEYLSAVLQWIDTLQQDLKRLSDIQAFLALHQKRWIELRSIHTDPQLDLTKQIRFQTHIGNINRQARTATPTAPYTTPTMKFESRKVILREQKTIHEEIVLVRDRFGAECVTRIGLNRWMLRKLFQEAGLEEQESARRRVEELKASNPSLAINDLVTSCRSAGSAEKLLEVLYLSLEHPSSWISDDRGKPDQAFTRELDGNFDRLLNPFFERVHHKPSKLMERASGAVKKGYQGATLMNKGWGVVKTILGLGAIYSAILALGSDAWNKSAELVREYTTPDVVLEYEAQFAREQSRKVAIADKTIVAVTDKENREDAEKSFSEVISNYVRENAGDRVALLFSQYLRHYQETGKTDWMPESPADRARMPQVADLVAMINVQLFNEGPYQTPDGKPQRFLSSAVIERWPWRFETEANMEVVMRVMRERERRTSFPLPSGIMPPSYKAPPAPVTQSKWRIAADKMWDRHLSKGLDSLWQNRPIRWGIIFAVGTVAFLGIRRQVRRRRQYRLVEVDDAATATF